MKYKPDWDEAKARLTALWNGETLDRACLSVTAPSGKRRTAPAPRDAEAKWLDPDTVIPTGLAGIENQWWGGESIPSYLLMAGWMVNFDAPPHFDWNTIWFDPVTDVDYDSPPDFKINPDDVETIVSMFQTHINRTGTRRPIVFGIRTIVCSA